MIHAEGLREALRHGGDTHTLEDVQAQIDREHAQLWETDRACIVTEIDQQPRKRILRFWLATGDLQEVLALSRGIQEWGRRIGCTEAAFVGRRGWEKVLKAEGWTPQCIVMTRKI